MSSIPSRQCIKVFGTFTGSKPNYEPTDPNRLTPINTWWDIGTQLQMEGAKALHIEITEQIDFGVTVLIAQNLSGTNILYAAGGQAQDSMAGLLLQPLQLDGVAASLRGMAILATGRCTVALTATGGNADGR